MTPDRATPVGVPFLGLNYFDERRAELFFGRDEQLRDVLAKLGRTRFVTVIGSSGTGKSSLVRAAVIPALREGFLTDVGSAWRTVTVFPRSSPVKNLAEVLEKEFAASGLEVTLRRGRLGLIEAVRQCGQRDGENLLVFVDQFEEIFRYQRVAADRRAAADEAAAFVQLLLEASAGSHPAIFVMITMRSDYLGACAQFRDLPERINSGLYLIPRMRRDQMQDAITGPAAVAGGTFSTPLVQRLLNDAGEDPDQLSVLQHALLRTWLNWKRDPARPPQIGFEHYERTGGVRDGLNNHAEEIYNGLSARDRAIAAVVFRSLTERDPSSLDVRRPSRTGTIMSIAGATLADIERVTKPFREREVAFLQPPVDVELTEDVSLDITHESLIRKWYRLGGLRVGGVTVSKGWVQDEADLRDQYRDLVKRARAALPAKDVLAGADLDAALAWREARLPIGWARRYDPDAEAYGIVEDYVSRSVAARDRARRWRRLSVGLGLVGVAAIFITTFLFLQSTRDLSRETELRREAEGFRDLATARQLAVQADALRERDSRPELSALLAIEAVLRSPLPEATQALRWPVSALRKPAWSKEASEKGGAAGASDDTLGDPDSKVLFSDSGEYLGWLAGGAVRIYRAADGQELRRHEVPGLPSSMAWVGAELHVATFVEHGTDDLAQAVVLAVPAAAGDVREIARIRTDHNGPILAPDGRRLLIGSDLYTLPQLTRTTASGLVALGVEGLSVYENRRQGGFTGPLEVRKDDKLLGSFDGTPPVSLLDLGGTSPYFASGDTNGVIRVFEKELSLPKAGQLTVRAEPRVLALSPDGTRLVIGSRTGEVRVIRWSTLRLIGAWSHTASIAAVAFSADGRSVASADEAGALRVVPLAPDGTGPQRDWVPLTVDRRLDQGTVQFDPTGRFVLLRAGSTGALLDARTGEPVVEVERTGQIAMSPDGGHLAVADARGVGVIDVATIKRRPLPSVLRDREQVVSLAVAPNGKYVALRSSIARDDRFQVVDVERRAPVRLPPSLSAAGTPAFSPDGRFLLVASARLTGASVTVFLVRCGAWTIERSWTIGAELVTPAFSPDGTSLFVRGAGPKRGAEPLQRFIDLSSLAERALEMPQGDSAATGRYSPDGKMFVLATNGRTDSALLIFDAPSAKLRSRMPLDETPSSLVLSQQGRYLAGTFHTAGVRVFELATRQEVGRIALGATERIRALMLSDDGRTVSLVSQWMNSENQSSDDFEIGVRTQSLAAPDLIRAACARVSRPLSETEWKFYLPEYPYRDSCSVALSK